MNCTDSGLENLRAISIASLMTTARGVFGYPRTRHGRAHNVPIDGRHALHAPMLRMAFNQSIDVGGSIGRGAEQVIRETPNFLAHLISLGPERAAHVIGALPAHVRLKEHLPKLVREIFVEYP